MQHKPLILNKNYRRNFGGTLRQKEKKKKKEQQQNQQQSLSHRGHQGLKKIVYIGRNAQNLK